MRTALIVLILGLTASSVMSTACTATNWAIDATNPVAANVETTTAAGVAFADASATKCAWTAGTTMTCIKATGTAQADYITGVQTYISGQRTTLQDAAGVRDKFFLAQRGEVIKLLGNLRRLSEVLDGDKVPAGATNLVTLFDGFVEGITKNFTALVANLEELQTARAACIADLLQTQAAVICEGAKAVRATGVTYAANTAVAIDDIHLKRLATKCLPYIQHSATQSNILYANLYSKIISAAITALDGGAAADVTKAITDFNAITLPVVNAQLPSRVPTACASNAESDGCVDWIEQNYFTNGALNIDKIVTGGDTTKITLTRRLEEGNQRRRLALNTGLNPTLASYGFDVAFATNPGNIDNKQNANSALRNGIVACAVAALALVF